MQYNKYNFNYFINLILIYILFVERKNVFIKLTKTIEYISTKKKYNTNINKYYNKDYQKQYIKNKIY